MSTEPRSSFVSLGGGALATPVDGGGDIGSAVRQLATKVANQDRDVGLVAKRALWRMVRHAGRPGADPEKAIVITALIALLQADGSTELHRELLWMLSEIGSDEAVEPIAGLLTDQTLREDARMALERIPTAKAVALLETAFANAPEDFKTNLAQSLRSRGVLVDGVPCQKMVPTKKTILQATE